MEGEGPPLSQVVMDVLCWCQSMLEKHAEGMLAAAAR